MSDAKKSKETKKTIRLAVRHALAQIETRACELELVGLPEAARAVRGLVR